MAALSLHCFTGFSLVAASGVYSVVSASGVYSVAAVGGILTGAASLVAETGSRVCGFSSCSSPALEHSLNNFSAQA